MSNFSKLERGAARFLARFPLVKNVAKYAYSRLAYLKSKKPYRYRSFAVPRCCFVGGESSFFGYYDKSPASSSGNWMVYSTAFSTKELPRPGEPVSLMVFLRNSDKPSFGIDVRAYNWQQGARAHWLDDDLFIFNDFDYYLNSYVARVYSCAEKKELKRFRLPVQDSFGTDFFLSINYRRLLSLRPDYGYRNLPPLTDGELRSLDEDGIWFVDFETGSYKLLTSLSQACDLKPAAEFDLSLHKINHVMISPSGEKYIFIHRYLNKGRRFDRLVLGDIKTGELQLISDYGMVSHCFWVDDDTVIGYMRGPGYKDGYWVVDICEKIFSRFADGVLDKYGDGHPHVVGDWFVTDTYPDKARMQHLLLCNWKTGEVRKLGEFFHGFEYDGETRCDLHPRLSPDGKTVFFDSVFSGKRQLYSMELPT
ncbi:hypothetical protein [Halomonas rhizosphaerae]|uniref:Glycosyl transferase n=1 Tax=Halomonas rhizosphaerae TaxID=3043296 RepID=A0ABT6UWD2_9GAMM|nr:hypothetical protein [Halomonas rhizosphaerae]MDI5890278.1 hypothetical protein [Halomonas rhizosphaerae]